MKRILALTLAALAAFPPLAMGQLQGGDVDLSEVRLEREPTVGIANIVHTLVYNNGTQPVYATVQFTYADGAPLAGQSGVDDTNGRVVPAGESRNINLTWIPPADRPGNQVIRVLLRAQGDSFLGNNEKSLTTFVRAPAVNVTLESPLRANLSPGTVGFLRYAVRNDGNAPDTYLVEVDGNASWNVRHLGDPGVVQPGHTRYGEVMYTAPSQGLDRNLTLRVTATSTQRANITATATTSVLLNSNFTLAPIPRLISLTGLPDAAQVLPGENVTFELTLRNHGTAEDVILLNATIDHNTSGWHSNLTAPANATGWNATPDANGTLAVALSPGQGRLLRLNVTRLENATVETANLTLNARSNDSALLRALQPNGEYAVRLDARLVNASPEVALLGYRVPDRAYQGDDLLVSIQLANLGRLPAPPGLIRVELTDGTFALRQEEIKYGTLAPNTHVNLTWVTRSNDLQGKYRIVGRLVPNATRGDLSLDNNQAATDLLVRRPEIALRAPDVVDVTPGARLLLLGASTGISVSNQGLADETLHVRLWSDQAEWLTAEWTVDVPAAGSVVLPLTVDVPQYPHLANIQARVRATLQGRPEFSTNATLTLRLDDQQGPDARLLTPDGPGIVGERARIRVEADDATGIGDASIILVTPSGERVLLTLTQNGTNATWWDADYAPARPGRHLIEVRLGDATPARHATVLPNLTWDVQERPYRGFEPVNFADRANLNTAFLKLKETDPGTTASVEADAGDGYRPLGFPYEVRPTGWTEGPHVLRVRATSLGGQTWTRAWNVTLDTTPPAVTDLQVNARGGLTTVTIRADGATEVTARFTHPAGEWETRLHPAASRTFSATMRPPDAWTGLTVLAKDAAGNVASLDHETSRDRTPLPLLAGLAALALAALARRRR